MQNSYRAPAYNKPQPRSPKRKMILLIALSLILVIILLVAYFLLKSRRLPPTQRLAVGKVATLAGAGYPGLEDGANYEAAFADPFGVAIDSKGNLVIAEGGAGNRLRRITLQGQVETIAGSDEGFMDGDGTIARFNTPSGIAFDQDDNLIIADTSNNRIRKLDAKGQVTTLAGSGARGLKDGPALEATFDAPLGVAADAQGNVYVADTYNDCIRKISSDGQVSTLAGKGLAGYRDGPAFEALFDTPCGIAVDKLGNLFVADTGNQAIRKLTAQGDVITIAGGTKVVGEASPGGEVRYLRPAGIVLTHDGFLFVADQGNSQISQISPDGESQYYAGWQTGFANGTGVAAKFNSPSGIAVDKQGALYVADTQNYLIRKLEPTLRQTAQDYFASLSPAGEVFIQPQETAQQGGEGKNGLDGGAQTRDLLIPRLDKETLRVNAPFLWPLSPQNHWHEVAGVVGEVRGSFAGQARDHLHSGLDIAGKMGEPCLSILNEKVSAPISNWGYNDTGEGLRVGLISYIHIRIGRDVRDQIQFSEKFKPRFDETGKLAGVRVRRGTRFNAGEFIGTLNRLYHVHLNLGPRNAEANAIEFPFAEFKDTVAPIIEPNGIEILNPGGQPFKEKVKGRLQVTGDVQVVVTAYDQVDGNNQTRKLGLYKLGYQLLSQDNLPAKGFEQPLFNIEFNRLPATEEAVKIVYAEGSGVSAYGTPTKFKYIVTNRARDGQARQGLLRLSQFKPGNYILKVIAEDYSGNRAAGRASELAIVIQ